VAAFLDCRLEASHQAGDHLIFVGEVLALGIEPGVAPLLFHGSQYRRVHVDE
jgi:3-hydroxy-9,10-secoandrosta-1,3,5(10)-triene-9,17-dione monooxygenase reductase component